MFEKFAFNRAKKKYTSENIRSQLINHGVHGFSHPVGVDVENPVVAAVGAQFRIFDNLTEYILYVNSLVKNAASRQATLVVFPQFFSLVTLSLIPKYYSVIKPDRDGTKPNAFEIYRRLDDEKLNMLNSLSLDLLKELARIYKLYIVSGATIVRRSEKIYLRAYVIDDKGEIIGHQDKLYNTPDCADEGLTYAEGISIIETDIGHLSILIGSDASQWQAYKTAVEAGSDIIAAPVAVRHAHNPYLAMRDIQSNVQYYYAFAIKACFIGADEIGLHFSGKSLIAAPYRMTECRNGILALASSPEKAQVVTAHLNMNALKTYNDPYLGK